MQHHIFYYSATGNSLAIARLLAEGLDNSTVKHLAHMDEIETLKFEAEALNSSNEGRTAVVVFPVFYWGVPLGVVNFVKNFPWQGYDRIYAVANFGGLPGLALEQMDGLVKDRNFCLDGGFLIQMPGNYLVNYTAFPQWFQRYLFKKMVCKVQRVGECIRNGEQKSVEKGITWLDRYGAANYYAKTSEYPESDRQFTVDDKCNGCGICSQVCHFDNIEMVDGRPEWQHHCEHCMACIQLCPKIAIEYGKRTKGRKRYKHPDISLKDLMR